jgi:hypothetical protein
MEVTMIDPISIQNQLYDVNSGLADKISRDIGSYSTALLSVTGVGEKEELHLCGSASLVCIEDEVFILTATHVWNLMKDAAGVGLTLDKEDVDHRCFIPVEAIYAYGPKLVSERDPWGPDMQLLKIPSDYVTRLKGQKQFYPLTTEIPEPPNVSSLEVWILMGSPAEQSKALPKHVSLTMNGIFATIRSEYNFSGLDYFDLDMRISFPGIPKWFDGVSGGGLWSVLLYGSPNGDIRWITTLVGMACWQLPLQAEIRPVRCLGSKSIRSLISEIPKR